MKSHPLLAEEEDRNRAMAGLSQKEPEVIVGDKVVVVEEKDKEPDPELVWRDIRIEELEQEKLELIAMN